MGHVDIAMLVGQTVAGVVPDELDIGTKFIASDKTGICGGHGMAVIHGVNPLISGNGKRDGVFACWQAGNETCERHGFTLPVVGARKSPLA